METISALATGAGTLVLAVATFASVRSANRAARAAERSLLAGLRPLLVSSQLQDITQKVQFIDEAWFELPGNGGVAEISEDAIYLVISLRNVGPGMAVLDGWWISPDRLVGSTVHADLERFHRLSRDLYIAPGTVGFWQGALRDKADPAFAAAADVITQRGRFTVELLYGDYEGGQRMVSRFGFAPRKDGKWFVSASRHWNIDRPDPR